MKYLIDPANLKAGGGGFCKRKVCEPLCSLCGVLCPNENVPLYGVPE